MALAGKGTLHLVESGRLGIDLRALTNVVLKTEATGWSVAGRGNTPLTSLEARYQIVNGGLMFDSIAAQSGTTTYFGIGQVDVRGRAIDLNLAHASATASEVPVLIAAVRDNGTSSWRGRLALGALARFDSEEVQKTDSLGTQPHAEP